MRVYAAMAEKQRELVNERTRAALVVAKNTRGYGAATGLSVHSGAVCAGSPNPGAASSGYSTSGKKNSFQLAGNVRSTFVSAIWSEIRSVRVGVVA